MLLTRGEITRLSPSVVLLQRKFRSTRPVRIPTMTFLLKSYNGVLNLNQKDNCKIFKDGSKGLKEKDI